MSFPTGLNGKWNVGAVEITRHVELETDKGNQFILPGATKDVVKSVPWLYPTFANERGAMKLSIHMLVIDTPDGKRIGVDTCIGNDKKRGFPAWTNRSGPFVEEITQAGYAPETFTHIMCTHLHVDHVGFNTILDKTSGKWLPTFPNAKYIFGKTEFEHWLKETRETGGSGGTTDSEIMHDSILPIVEAGLSMLVDSDAIIVNESNCIIRLIPTPGHTPGHISVFIQSNGEEALITGDCIHHPVQMARLDIGAVNADSDIRQASQTRMMLLGRLADDKPKCRVFGTHFATPSCGFVRRDGAAFKFILNVDEGKM